MPSRLLLLIFMSLLAPCNTLSLAKSPSDKYRFKSGEDWFSGNVTVWTKHLSHLKGKQNLKYLEIGVFEGRSFFWALENIFYHRSSTLTALDPFGGSYFQTFEKNLKASGASDRVQVMKEISRAGLYKLPQNHFDVIYIDGSHKSKDVLTDAIVSFDLLKNGGILIFDDYKWPKNWPESLLPKSAVDIFLNQFSDQITILHKGYQVLIKKLEDPCNHNPACTYFSGLVYDWEAKALKRAKTGVLIPLKSRQQKLLENFLRETEGKAPLPTPLMSLSLESLSQNE